jgi:hypothetical protein
MMEIIDKFCVIRSFAVPILEVLKLDAIPGLIKPETNVIHPGNQGVLRSICPDFVDQTEVSILLKNLILA